MSFLKSENEVGPAVINAAIFLSIILLVKPVKRSHLPFAIKGNARLSKSSLPNFLEKIIAAVTAGLTSFRHFENDVKISFLKWPIIL